ncbi:MFS transporter (plasmid) [Rhodococcoides fascians A21d2]|uniref:MFS transporter n=1 Tax=Rhodococcoides fascians TaxID=1828 RepID=UPI0013EEF850|nr:MFS transporter [Rhodococcus fascians]QII03795.1 MFS transporter [Rhodococcus fascians A21d2]
MPTALYSEYERQFGFSLLTITVVYAVYAVGVLTALIAFGRWSDVLGRRPMLAIGVGCAAASDVVFLLADSSASLVVARVVSGLSAGVFVGTAAVAIVEMAQGPLAKRAPLLASLATMGGLGLGPVAASLLANWAPEPLRTTYWVHLGLLVAAGLVIAMVPETRERSHPRERLGMTPLTVPIEIRGFFLRSAVLGFAGFAVLGLFTALAPTIAARFTGVDSGIGQTMLVVSVMAGSLVGQIVGRVFGDHLAELTAVAAMIAGMALLAASLLIGRWELLAGAGSVGGFGQGMAFARGLAGIATGAPADRKAATTSAYFVITYVAISIPVVVEGLLAQIVGVRTAGLVFAAAVSLLAFVAGVLARRSNGGFSSTPPITSVAVTDSNRR